MTPLISLVVPLREPGDRLRHFVASIDQQVLPGSEWEVVFVRAGGRHDDGLDRLAEFRPNVSVVRVDRRSSTWFDLVRAGAAAASGDWLLVSDVEDTLTRAALVRLAEAAKAAGDDVCAIAGRTVDRARNGNDETLVASGQLDPARAVEYLAGPAVLVRGPSWRRVADDTALVGELPVVQLALSLAAAGGRLSLVDGYPVVVGAGLANRLSPQERTDDVLAALERPGADPGTAGTRRSLAVLLARAVASAGAGAGSLTELSRVRMRSAELAGVLDAGPERTLLRLVAAERFELAGRLAHELTTLTLSATSTAVSWIDGVARVSVVGTVGLPSALLADLEAAQVDDLIDVGDLFVDATARIGLRNRLTTNIYLVPTTEQSVETSTDQLRVAVTADIDVASMDGGRRLPRGIYQITAELVGLGWAPVLQTLLTGDCDLPAVLPESLVSLRDRGGAGLHIDVDTAERSLLGVLSPRLATVVEDARGSLMALPVPGLHVQRSGELECRMVLGGLPFPGKLVLEGPPRLEVFVSGLPGSVEIKSQVGSARATSTGCELVTHMDGTFSVATLRPETQVDLSTTVASALTPAKARRTTPVPTKPAKAEPQTEARAHLTTVLSSTGGRRASLLGSRLRTTIKQVPGATDFARRVRSVVRRARA